MTFYSCSAMSLRTGLLVDLENIAYDFSGRLVTAAVVGDRLRQVLELAGPVHYSRAAAQRHMLTRYGAELAGCGLRWSECCAGPDEADKTLIDAGVDLVARSSYGRIVVASGDHIFARLATLCELRVAVPAGVAVSRELSAVATVLTASHRPAEHITDPSPNRPGDPPLAA